jgi:hypothetical protein
MQIIAGITIFTRKSGEIAIWSHHKKSEEMPWFSIHQFDKKNTRVKANFF